MNRRKVRTPPFRLRVAVVGLLAALLVSGCANSRTSTGTYAGESGANAPYLDVGALKYEVQLSRELNPTNTEDASYLQGLTPEQRHLEAGQEWFAVFLQVYNDSNHELPATTNVTISDTQGNTYTPITPSTTNEYAYRAGQVPAKSQLPVPDSVAYYGPTQGALLLFKIAVVSLDNRPLTIQISDPENPSEAASAELDV